MQPFVEETIGIGEERTSLTEHLRVCCPSQSLVALRTVGRNAQIVGAHSPNGVRDKLVHKVVTRGDISCFHFGRDAADRHGLYVFYRDFIGGGDVEVAVAKERLTRGVVYGFLAIGKSVIQSDTLVVNAQ